MTKNKMDKKNLMVTFCALALVMFLAGTVSAAGVTSNYQVTVNGVSVLQSYTGNSYFPNSTVAVTAGSQVTLKVYFTSQVNDSNVNVKATLEGSKVSISGQSPIFDVEAGHQYVQELTLNVPYELQNQVSSNLVLSINIDGTNYRTDLDNINLRVQRPSYNVNVMSVTTPSSITAGQQIPVDIVLKNTGYDKLNDVYASAQISSLGVSQGPKWFGDLVSLDNCTNNCNQENAVQGTLYLKIPYGAKPGVYNLQVVVQNNDVKTVQTKQIVINNDYVNTVLATNPTQSVSVGQEAKYNLLLVNPTNNVKVYRLVTSGSLTADNSVVAVPAGSSSTVTVTGSSNTAGDYKYNVSVYDGSTLVQSVPLEMNVQGGSNNTVVVLTIVLAVIFLVLLAVLIVLLTRKPEKQTEEFGESYY